MESRTESNCGGNAFFNTLLGVSHNLCSGGSGDGDGGLTVAPAPRLSGSKVAFMPQFAADEALQNRLLGLSLDAHQ